MKPAFVIKTNFNGGWFGEDLGDCGEYSVDIGMAIKDIRVESEINVRRVGVFIKREIMDKIEEGLNSTPYIHHRFRSMIADIGGEIK